MPCSKATKHALYIERLPTPKEKWFHHPLIIKTW